MGRVFLSCIGSGGYWPNSPRVFSTSPQRRRRQAALMISPAMIRSRAPSGRRSSMREAVSTSYAEVSQESTKSRLANRPCEVEFRAERALPSGVDGPVEAWAFSWLAAIWASVDIGLFLFNFRYSTEETGFCRVSRGARWPDHSRACGLWAGGIGGA